MTPNKIKAVLAVVAAIFVAATLFYPPLLPLCQALTFCPPTTAVAPE